MGDRARTSTAFCKALLDRRRLPDRACTTPTCTTCGCCPIAASCSSASCRRSARPRSSWRRSTSGFPRSIIGRGVFLIAALPRDRAASIGWRLAVRVAERARSGRASGCCSSAPAPPRVDAGARAVRAPPRARRRDRRLRRSRSGAGRRAGHQPGVIGTIDDIPSIVRARGVDRVVVSLADARGKLPMDKLLEMKLDGVTFDHSRRCTRSTPARSRSRTCVRAG